MGARNDTRSGTSIPAFMRSRPGTRSRARHCHPTSNMSISAGDLPGRIPVWHIKPQDRLRLKRHWCGSFGVRLFSQEGFRVPAGGFPHLGELTGLYDDNPPSCDNAPSGTRMRSPVSTKTLPDTTTLPQEHDNPPGYGSTQLAHLKGAAPSPLPPPPQYGSSLKRIVDDRSAPPFLTGLSDSVICSRRILARMARSRRCLGRSPRGCRGGAPRRPGCSASARSSSPCASAARPR